MSKMQIPGIRGKYEMGDTPVFTPKEKPEPINNSKLVEEFRSQGGRIVHIHTDNNHNGRRAMTVAFIPRSGHVEVSTSVTHRSDTFTKKVGTKLAIENFKAGKKINIPLTQRNRVTEQVQSVFEIISW